MVANLGAFATLLQDYSQTKQGAKDGVMSC